MDRRADYLRGYSFNTDIKKQTNLSSTRKQNQNPMNRNKIADRRRIEIINNGSTTNVYVHYLIIPYQNS